MRPASVLLLSVSLFASSAWAQPASPPSRASAPNASSNDASHVQASLEWAKRGDAISAMRTLGKVKDPEVLAEALAKMRAMDAVTVGRDRGESTHADAGIYANDGEITQDPRRRNGAAGGGALADYSSLMDLIQTTVSPETWEALGGPSSLRPYPGGILVDAKGVIQDIKPLQNEQATNLSKQVTQRPRTDAGVNRGVPDADAFHDQPDWMHPAKMRCVSLKGLATEVLQRRLSGVRVDDVMRHMAGISRVQYVIFDPQDKDIVLAGPVGGIEQFQGWYRDQKTGLTTLRIEDFCAAVSATLSGQPFGCTIDPTQASLARASVTAAAIQAGDIKLGRAAESLRESIGLQDVHVFGTAGDTSLGYLMVEADRHMKQLALGLKPMPKDMPNYLDMVTRHIANGPPNDQLLRLWFTAHPMAVRVDAANGVYELAGRAMKLDRETKGLAADGQRIIAPPDVRIDDFVSSFNQNFIDIVHKYPIYGALHSVYVSAGVAELVRRGEASAWLPAILGPMLLDDPAEGRLPAPRQVDSIATLHQVTHRRQRHSIIVASGGVLVETRETLEPEFRPYETLASLKDGLLQRKASSMTERSIQSDKRNADMAGWWWNAN